MRGKRWLMGTGVALAALAAGCDERDAAVSKPEPSPPAATRPAAVVVAPPAPAPAPRPEEKPPAPPQPVNTFLYIQERGQQRTAEFPPAKLRLKRTDEGLLAVLYTDDPPAAASADYTGNSYLFEMRLDGIHSPADLTRAQWVHQAADGSAGAETTETNDGIFLDGLRRHLQPVNAAVVFEGAPPQVVVKIMGTFRAVANPQRGSAPQVVQVSGMLPAMLEVDSKDGR